MLIHNLILRGGVFLAIAACMALPLHAQEMRPSSGGKTATQPSLPSAETIAIAAVVNDEVITSLDVNERLALVMATSSLSNTPEVITRLMPQIVETLISETLQLQEAKRLSITVAQKEIEAAIANIEKERNRPPGSLEAFLKERGVPIRALTYQVRAQLAWNKVVSRKVRRSVVISEEEILRAQKAEASAGEEQVRIAAISLAIASPQQEPEVSALAKELQQQLAKGADFNALAAQLSGRSGVKLNPSVWIPERALEPSLAQALRGLKPGEITTPLRSLSSYQIIQLLDRETVKPTSDETEVAIKEILLPLTGKNIAAKEVDALIEIAREIAKNPGSCDEASVAGIEGVDTASLRVQLVRTQLKRLSRELRIIVERLSVGEVSEPLAARDGVRLLMICEKVTLPMTLPEREKIRAQLYNEKLELEANKLLRNLRREAFIEIKEKP